MYLQEGINYRPLSQEETAQRANQLREKLASHETEPVLVVVRGWNKPGLPRHEYISGCFGGRHVFYNYLEEARYLGISSEPFLAVTDIGRLLIYTPRQAFFKGGRFSMNRHLMVEDQPIGSLAEYSIQANALEVPLNGRKYNLNGKGLEPGLAVEILIGDEVISAHYLQAAEKRLRDLINSDADLRVNIMRQNNSQLYRSMLDKNLLAEYEQMKAALFEQQAPLFLTLR